ncbi:hypothetical protein RCZ04_10750 [Capnocytophaga sp. HP1101]
MKRIITLLLLIATASLYAQKTVTETVSQDQNSPLFVVNGVLIDNSKVGSTFLSTIEPNDIESINVLKGTSAIGLCSQQAQNGVVVITLKKAEEKPKKGNLSGIKLTNKDFPLVIVDEVEFSNPEAGKLFISNINPERVESITVLKDKKATEKYGDKAKNGVVLVALKGEKPEKLDIPPYEPKP